MSQAMPIPTTAAASAEATRDALITVQDDITLNLEQAHAILGVVIDHGDGRGQKGFDCNFNDAIISLLVVRQMVGTALDIASVRLDDIRQGIAEASFSALRKAKPKRPHWKTVQKHQREAAANGAGEQGEPQMEGGAQ